MMTFNRAATLCGLVLMGCGGGDFTSNNDDPPESLGGASSAAGTATGGAQPVETTATGGAPEAVSSVQITEQTGGVAGMGSTAPTATGGATSLDTTTVIEPQWEAWCAALGEGCHWSYILTGAGAERQYSCFCS
jgi:hypothetical protein